MNDRMINEEVLERLVSRVALLHCYSEILAAESELLAQVLRELSQPSLPLPGAAAGETPAPGKRAFDSRARAAARDADIHGSETKDS